MLEIGNKIYYLKSNGNIISETGDAMGYVVETDFDEDYENYTALKQYEKDKIGCIQFKFGELRRLLEENKANSYKVDVSSSPHKLIFEWIDYDTGKPTEPPKTTEELIKEEADKVRLEYAVAVAELTEKIEKDKVELSTAIVEAIEMKAGGTV
ncbi:hypothetical protein [Peptostreptococcus sp.]|uniref:hypothetical protein n=1 Tax=Peptostreptococcus sp. TaxID=1262 RepID=UPI001D704951|nr:hypothetical protein [Peptostreptococcus sp.]MBS5595654.1 hypothetical protein [Peptostreptococcus sp.]